MYFKNKRLDPSKTTKANPEGGTSQTVERARLQENFVAKYTARQTPSTTDPSLKLVEIIVKPVGWRRWSQGMGAQEVSANHFDIPPVPSSSGPVSCYNQSAGPVSYYKEGAVSAPGSGAITAPQPGSDPSAQFGAEKKKGSGALESRRPRSAVRRGQVPGTHGHFSRVADRTCV